MSGIRAREHERILNLAVTALHERDPDQLWPPIIAELLRVYDAQLLVLDSEDWTDRRGAVQLWKSDGTSKRHIDDHVQRFIRHSNPLTDHYAAGDDRAPVTAAQLVGEGAWQAGESARRMRELLGADQVLGLPMPDSARPVRGFLIYRAGTGFTPEHLNYAQRIQPLLAGVDRQVSLLNKWRASLPKAPAVKAGLDPAARAAEKGLTPREMTVLTLLADALTASTIGRHLGISVRTAQKHIESIYRKLGTKDRVATVLRAQAYGLIPAGGRTASRAG